MKRTMLVLASVLLLAYTTSALAQSGDIALALGTLSAPSTSSNSLTLNPGMGGGTYIGFNGDVLVKHHLGIGAEVAWKASQGSYFGQAGYRPVLFDVDGVYARRFSKFFGAEALAGIGAESIRFYTGQYNCDFYGNCSNYVSSTHFMGDFGGGIRLYPYGNFFVRPEARLYLIHNNVEFASGRAVRYGVSIGYTFGGQGNP